MQQRRSAASLAAFLSLTLLCTGLFLWMTSQYLLPVAMGEILALACLPVHGRLSRLGWPRLSAALTTFALLVLVIAPVLLFAAAAAREGANALRELSEGKGGAERVEQAVGELSKKVGDPEKTREQARAALAQGAKGASVAALAAVKAVPGAALGLALGLLSCYFFLLDAGKLPRRLIGLLPLDEDLREQLVEAIRDTALATLRAGMAAAFAQAVVILAAFLVLRLPSPFLAAGVTFVASWVPMLGIIPAMLGGGAYLAWQQDWGRLAGLAAFGAVGGLADNVVRPLVLKGGGDRMHPLLSLIAIFGGVQVFGVVGLFLGPILAALLVALYQVWPSIARRYGLEVKALPKSGS